MNQRSSNYRKKRLQNHVVVFITISVKGGPMGRCSTTLFVNATRPRNLVITSPSPLFSTDLSNNTRVSRICCRRILAWFPFSLSLSPWRFQTPRFHPRLEIFAQEASHIFILYSAWRTSFWKNRIFLYSGTRAADDCGMRDERKGRKRKNFFFVPIGLFTLTWRSIVNFYKRF